jgi:hypothetical protein
VLGEFIAHRNGFKPISNEAQRLTIAATTSAALPPVLVHQCQWAAALIERSLTYVSASASKLAIVFALR